MRAVSVWAISLLVGAAAYADTPKTDLDAVRQLMERERYSDALPLARHAVVDNAGSASAHDLLAQILIRLDRPTEAIAELKTAAGLAPSDKEVLTHLGDAYLSQYAQSLAAWRKIHSTDTMLGTLTSPIPGSMAGGSYRYAPEGAPVLGETDRTSQMTRNEHDARNPRFDPGHSAMGALDRPVAAMNVKEREKMVAPARLALSMYDKALAVDPNAVTPLMGRAASLYALAEFADAGDAYKKAAAAVKTDDMLYRMAADAYTRCDRPSDAIEMWEEAIKIEPARREAYRSLQDLYGSFRRSRWEGRYYEAMENLLAGKPEAALDGLQWVTERQPDYAPGWRATGSAYIALKDYKKAAESLEKAVAADPKDGLSEYQLGAALMLAGNTDAAHGHLLRAAQLRPDYAPVWYNLGLQAEKSNDPDTAIEMYGRAVTLRPTWAEAQYSLGALLLEKRRSADALDHLERYLALRPDAPDSKDVQKAVDQLKAMQS